MIRVEKTCKGCGTTFHPRLADVNRGWGKYCSKRCKAIVQTKITGIDGPDYRASGLTVGQMRNGKKNKSKFKSGRTPWAAAGVSKATYLYYANEYGGTPVFDGHGEYEGFIPEPFDNSTDCQNSE